MLRRFNCYCDQSTHFCYWVHSKNTHSYISTKAFESKNCLDLSFMPVCHWWYLPPVWPGAWSVSESEWELDKRTTLRMCPVSAPRQSSVWSNQRTEMEQLDQSDKSGDRDLSEEEEIRNINMYCNTLAWHLHFAFAIWRIGVKVKIVKSNDFYYPPQHRAFIWTVKHYFF